MRGKHTGSRAYLRRSHLGSSHHRRHHSHGRSRRTSDLELHRYVGGGSGNRSRPLPGGRNGRLGGRHTPCHPRMSQLPRQDRHRGHTSLAPGSVLPRPCPGLSSRPRRGIQAHEDHCPARGHDRDRGSSLRGRCAGSPRRDLPAQTAGPPSLPSHPRRAAGHGVPLVGREHP